MTTDATISGVRIREFPGGAEYVFPPQKAVLSTWKMLGPMKHATLYAAIAVGIFFISQEHHWDVAFLAKAVIVMVVAMAGAIRSAGQRRSPVMVTIRPAELTVKQGGRLWGKPLCLKRNDLIDARLSAANDDQGNWLFAVRRTTGKPLILVRGPAAALQSMGDAVGRILELKVICINAAMAPGAAVDGAAIPVAEAADLWDYPAPPPDKRFTLVAADRLLVMELKKIMPTSGWALTIVGISLVPVIYFLNYAPHRGFYMWMVLPVLATATGIGLLILSEFRTMVLVATPEEFSVKVRPWPLGRTRRWSAEDIAQFTVQTANGGHTQRTEMRLLVMTLRRGKAVIIFRTSKLTFHQVGYMSTELRHFYCVKAAGRPGVKMPSATLVS